MENKKTWTYEQLSRRQARKRILVILFPIISFIFILFGSRYLYHLTLGVLQFYHISTYLMIGLEEIVLGITFISIQRYVREGIQHPECGSLWFQIYYERRPRWFRKKIERRCAKDPGRTPKSEILRIIKIARIFGWVMLALGITLIVLGILLLIVCMEDLKAIYGLRLMSYMMEHYSA